MGMKLSYLLEKCLFSFDHIFFRIILGFTSCVSVLVISLQKDNSFSAFTFMSSVVTISSFTSASASYMIASVWYLFFFLFFKPSIISFSVSVFISVGFILLLWAWIIEEKVFLFVEYLYWFFFFFSEVSLPFFDKGIANFIVFEMSLEVRYHFSVNFHEAFLILFRAFSL